MKTKYKIRVLFLSVITVLILFVIAYQFIRSREISIYLKSKNLSDIKVVDKVLDLKAASFMKPTIDNSAWDGMVDFVSKPDKKWAEENIVPVRKTFDMDFFGVWDINGKNIYAVSDTIYNLLKISETDIKGWFLKNKTVHTFLNQNDNIYEIFAAVVVPSFDINYTTREKGFVITAKRWDPEYISEISKLTGFEVNLVNSQKFDSSKTAGDEIIYKYLKNSGSNTLAVLEFIKENEYRDELSNIRIMLFIGFSILIITVFVFVYLTNRWLTNPLKNITESLVDGNLIPIEDLLKQNNEFGDIANLVKKFNEQKNSLINEIKEKTEATEKFKALLTAQPDLMFIFGKDGTCLDFYTQNVDLLLGNPENLIGSNIKAYFPSELAEKIISILNEVSAGKKSEPFEYNLTLSGVIKTFESRFVAIDKNRILAIVRDISEKKASDEALRNEKKLSDTIIETLPGGFFMTDFDGRFIRRNEYYDHLHNTYQKKPSGDSILDFVYAEDLEDAGKLIKEARETGHSEAELRYEFQPGKIKWFYISAKKLVTESNSFIIGTSLDISKRKKAEHDLIAAKELAEESEKLKTNFLANMSHELRTPMVGILGYSDLLKSELADEELKGMADNIFKSGNRLMETLNLILDLSRIEAGKLAVNYSVFDISETIENSVSLYSKVVQPKGVELSYLNSGKKMLVNLDERIVRDILNNIINNAVKYTMEGSITVSSNAVFIDEMPFIKIEVRDTGIGIPQDKLSFIFEEFRQVSEGLSRGFEGTGLGLSLTKKFVEKMKGKVTVESELGKGSLFTVTLPININENTLFDIQSGLLDSLPADIESNEEISETPNKKFRKKILVIDNDETTLILISAFLTHNYSVDTAKSGKEAINLANLNNYDLILMDINLGKNDDGLTVTKAIRDIQGFKDVPVIAVTAYAMKGDREKFIMGGCTDYISKPFVQADLLNMIERVLNQ